MPMPSRVGSIKFARETMEVPNELRICEQPEVGRPISTRLRSAPASSAIIRTVRVPPASMPKKNGRPAPLRNFRHRA